MISLMFFRFLLTTTHPKGAIVGEDGSGSGFTSHGFFPLSTLMKHTPYIFGWLRVTHTIKPGVGRFMDGVLVGDVTKYKSGSMVMSKKDGLGMELFFWGDRNEYDDIRHLVPYLADEELAKQTSAVVRKYLEKWGAFEL